MKKVCHITTVHSLFDTRIFYKEAKTLANAGYDVALIAQHDKEEIVEGIKIIPLPKPKNRLTRMLFLTRKAYKLALEQKADIYHFHDPEFLPWAIKLKKKTSAKIIYDVHEDIPMQILSKHWIPEILRKLVAWIFNIYEKNIAKKLDYIITATVDIKNNFKDQKVTDIKNYPVTELFLKPKIDYSKNNGEHILVYAGGLEKIRGIKEIVNALSMVNSKNNVKLKLFGKFLEKTFEKEVRNLKRWKKIEYYGWKPHQEVYKEFVKADIGLVCLYPLRRFVTALPIKMFEYMVAGLPIIASNFPLWKEIVEGNNCGICVNPLEPKEIAKAIEYLIKHTEEARKMGENGKKAVLQKYNWENESSKLIQIYSSLR